MPDFAEQMDSRKTKIEDPPVLRIGVMAYDCVLDYMVSESECDCVTGPIDDSVEKGKETETHVIIKIGATKMMSNLVPQSKVEHYKVALQDLEMFISNKNLSRDDDSRLLVHIEPGHNATFIASEDSYRPASSLKERLKQPLRRRESTSKKAVKFDSRHGGIRIMGMGRVQGKQMQVQEYLEQQGFVTFGTLDYFDLYHTNRKQGRNYGYASPEPGIPISDFEMFVGTLKIYTCADSLFFTSSAMSCLASQVAKARDPSSKPTKPSGGCDESAIKSQIENHSIDILRNGVTGLPQDKEGITSPGFDTKIQKIQKQHLEPSQTNEDLAIEHEASSSKLDDELSGPELHRRYAKKVTFEQPKIEDGYFRSTDMVPQQDLGSKKDVLGQSFMERSQFAVYYPQDAEESDSGSEQNSDDFEAMSDSDHCEEFSTCDVRDHAEKEPVRTTEHLATSAQFTRALTRENPASAIKNRTHSLEDSSSMSGSSDGEEDPMSQSMWALSSHHTLGLSFLHKEPEEFEMQDMSKSVVSLQTSGEDSSHVHLKASAPLDLNDIRSDGTHNEAQLSMDASLVLPVANLDDSTPCEVQLEMGGDLHTDLLESLRGQGNVGASDDSSSDDEEQIVDELDVLASSINLGYAKSTSKSVDFMSKSVGFIHQSGMLPRSKYEGTLSYTCCGKFLNLYLWFVFECLCFHQRR